MWLLHKSQVLYRALLESQESKDVLTRIQYLLIFSICNSSRIEADFFPNYIHLQVQQ